MRKALVQRASVCADLRVCRLPAKGWFSETWIFVVKECKKRKATPS